MLSWPLVHGDSRIRPHYGLAHLTHGYRALGAERAQLQERVSEVLAVKPDSLVPLRLVTVRRMVSEDIVVTVHAP
jgi:hypothetical protein